jgi:hypothetical protein
MAKAVGCRVDSDHVITEEGTVALKTFECRG